MGTGYFLGVERPPRGVNKFIVPFCEWVGAATPAALCACLGMSWGDFYIDLYILILSSHKQAFYIRNCSKVTLDVSDRTLAVE